MKKNARKILSVFLMVFILVSACAIPASATSSATGVDIWFYLPDNWNSVNYGPKIYLWNAGSSNNAWPGVNMVSMGDGVYRYTNYDLNSCNFVINDGYTLQNQTSDMYTNGKVTVKDNKITERSQRPTQLRFQKPANWGDDVYVYYYSDDNNEISMQEWPGKLMEQEIIYRWPYGYLYDVDITEFANSRVIFTDGVNQYPAAMEPGIQVQAGNTYDIKGSNVTSHDYDDTKITPSTNNVTVGQEFKIFVDAYSPRGLSIDDVGTSDMVIVDSETISYEPSTGRYVQEYTVKFTQAGKKSIYPYYSYQSASYYDKKVDIYVDKAVAIGALDIETPVVNLGDTITVWYYAPSEVSVVFTTEDGEELTALSSSYDIVDGKKLNTKTFRIDRRCENMKVYAYGYNWRSPYSRSVTGAYFTVTVK